MGSYNYLGFAENNADFMKTVADKTRQYGVGVCSTRQEMGKSGWLSIPRNTHFRLSVLKVRKHGNMWLFQCDCASSRGLLQYFYNTVLEFPFCLY